MTTGDISTPSPLPPVGRAPECGTPISNCTSSRVHVLTTSTLEGELPNHALAQFTPSKVSGTPLGAIGAASSLSSLHNPSSRKKLPSKHVLSNRQPSSWTEGPTASHPSGSKAISEPSTGLPAKQREPITQPSLFKWSPPSDVQESTVTGSTSSRGPAFFDLHLHEDLRLKRVVLVSDLAIQIGEHADILLERYGDRLPDENGPLPKKYPTMERLEDIQITQGKLKSELGVQTFYKTSIANHCLTLASMLLFGVHSPILTWSAQSDDKQAIADGFLSAKIGENSDLAAFFVDLQQELELLVDWHLDVVAIWEFKSLSVGKRALMDAILRLASRSPFPWTACTPRDYCNRRYHSRHDIRPVKTGRKTGPDCQPLMIALPVLGKRGYDDTFDLRNPAGCEADVGVEGEEEQTYNADPTVDEGARPPVNPPTNDGFSLDMSDIETSQDLVQQIFGLSKSQDEHDNFTTACHIIQQAWAEAVYNDATFIIINAGQYEFIAKRHRGSQILYISQVIKVCESVPAYGKLHTALYIVAFQDALNRAKQLRDIKRNPKAQFPSRYHLIYKNDHREYKHYETRLVQSEEESRKTSDERLEKDVGDFLRSCHSIRVHSENPLFHNEVHNFVRVSQSEHILDPDRHQEERFKSLSLMLTPFKTSVYSSVILFDNEPDDQLRDRYVFKLYQKKNGAQTALDEHARYIWLREQNFKGCVDALGLFRCIIAGRQRYGLLMTHGGCSLLDANLQSPNKRELLRPKCDSIIKELIRINISHNSLFLEHFVFDSKTKKLSLVSWGDAEEPVDDLAEKVGHEEGLRRSERMKRTHEKQQRRKIRNWEAENRAMVDDLKEHFKRK